MAVDGDAGGRDRLALVLGEHMENDDGMHLTYDAIQTGWQHDPGRAGWLARSAHTQPFVEYTACSCCTTRAMSFCFR